MSGNAITEFVASARAKNATDDQIRSLLLKNGWASVDIDHALLPVSEPNMPIPAPPAPHFGMWVAFLYVILFISLYVSSTAFGGILHQFVDEKFPDKLKTLSYSYPYGNNLMQGYLASLIVGFPIFAILFLFLKNMALKIPTLKSLRSRKLLVYLTLIGTFIIMLCHIIFTVYEFLGGSVSMRSVGHLVVTIFVAGSIFAYFIIDVAGDRKQS